MARRPTAIALALLLTLTGLSGPAAATTPSAPPSFSDITGTTHEAAIRAAAADGVLAGYPDNTFRPEQPVTRERMAIFLARAFDVPADDTIRFIDISLSTHVSSITALAGAGIAGGVDPLTFDPHGTVSRGQLTTFLARSLHLIPPTTPDEDRSQHEPPELRRIPEDPPIHIPGFEPYQCEQLNDTETVYPGTDLVLHYTIKATPNVA